MRVIFQVLIVIILIDAMLRVLYEQPKVYYKERLYKNYNARTIPPFGIWIRESERDNQLLLDHELMHWQQYRKQGLLPFLIGYFFQGLVNGYDKNKYEIEARFVESDYCKENYTECVRTGNAITVFEPNFRA